VASERPPEINEVARRLADALEDAGIPYALGGAIAYAYWGAARGTKDVDINVFVAAEAASNALQVLHAAGLKMNLVAAGEQAAERGDVRAHFEDVPVDLFFDSIPFHASAAMRAVAQPFMGRPAQVLSAEDITVLKLLFNRPKDHLDVERLVALQGPRLDRAYVRRWLVDCVGEDDLRVKRWDALTTAVRA
jgi:hypothetical protein